jgi:heat shock protein HtpX
MSNRARTHSSPDRQSARTLATMLLLGSLYAAFAAMLLALPGSWIVVVEIAAILLAAQFWLSDKIALLFALRGPGNAGQAVIPPCT